MKIVRYLIILIVISYIKAEDDEILKILQKSSKLNPPKYPDYEIYDPFSKALPAMKNLKEIKVKVTPPIPNLSAIIDDWAFIDGKWRRVGDIVKGYKIVSIKKSFVILKIGKNSIKLSVVSKKEIPEFKIIDRYKRKKR